MAIIRKAHNKENPYAQISRKTIQDKRLSLKAIGLLVRLLSLPGDWRISISDLNKKFKEGKDAIRSAYQELEEFNYIKRQQLKDGKGQFYDWEYLVYEEPHKDEAEEVKTPASGLPPLDKPTLLNNISNKEYITVTNTTTYKGDTESGEKESSAEKVIVPSNLHFNENHLYQLHSKYRERTQKILDCFSELKKKGKKVYSDYAYLITYGDQMLEEKEGSETAQKNYSLREELLLKELHKYYHFWHQHKKANDPYWQNIVGYLELKENYLQIYGKEIKFKRSLASLWNFLMSEFADDETFIENMPKGLLEKIKEFLPKEE